MTIERNLVIIETLKSRLPSLIAGDTKSPNRGKQTKPEDLMKMYDVTVQCLVEIGQLPGLEDDTDLRLELDAQMTGYKAYR